MLLLSNNGRVKSLLSRLEDLLIYHQKCVRQDDRLIVYAIIKLKKHKENYEERMQDSLIKEALCKENMVAYALRNRKASVDIEKELENHEVEWSD
ncbi:hypothetical protein DY000_02021870 [Brassica cretica]|uniref:Uncharacterized protein n=1 Tax=Brassica cretica TaxID=69181 RepID=A0ABQ7EBV0_BRACR|nr:hypothetical protein DY000_02021870 [Brassica cretica]